MINTIIVHNTKTTLVYKYINRAYIQICFFKCDILVTFFLNDLMNRKIKYN